MALTAKPITPRQVITQKSVDNALRLLMAIGGSTNAVIHLTAVAGARGEDFHDQLNRISDETPVLVDLKPVGEGYMEDFFAAGGVGAVLRELKAVAASGHDRCRGPHPGRAAGGKARLGGPQSGARIRQSGVEGGRADRAGRQSCAARRDLQARRGDREPVRA